MISTGGGDVIVAGGDVNAGVFNTGDFHEAGGEVIFAGDGVVTGGGGSSLIVPSSSSSSSSAAGLDVVFSSKTMLTLTP